MPIHLPPIDSQGRPTVSRREFLASLAAGGAALALGRRTWAADRDSSWYALVSDTHIAADPERVAREQVMSENLKAVVADILEVAASEGNPRGVFIDGDLAFNTGESGDYRVFLKLIEPLRKAGLPVHLAMGNHDDRGNFREALGVEAAREAAVLDRCVSVVNTPGLRFIVLDSLDKVNSTPGVLGDQQIAWLADRLDSDQKTPTLIFQHHYLQLPSNNHARGGLLDTEPLLEVIQPRKQVKGVVYGHSHRWEHGKVDGSDLPMVNLPAVGYVFAANQPIGWSAMRLGDGGVEFELRCIGGDTSKHGEKVEVAWRS